jgi:hypothetical protein
MQLNSAPRRKACGGFRESASHAEAIADAAERVMRARLYRKRARTLST